MNFVSPQLAHRGNGFGPTLLDDPNYVGEEKWDGLRVQIPIEGHRTQAVFSRTGRQMGGDGLQWIYALMWKVASATVDGEVCWPGVVASDVSARIAHGEEVNLELFDALALAGKSQLDREYLFRRALIEEIVRVQQDERVRVTKMSRDKRKLMEEVSVAGGEGLVMKHVNSVYLPGSRTKAWVKLHAPTRDKEYDVIVTGTTSQSTSERAQFRTGEATLTYGVWDPKLGEAVTVGQLSYVRSLEELLPLVGKVAVVKAKYQFSSGALRHGHVVRFRNDKPIVECVVPNDEQ
jgi:ATP-dependent DNA ligase